MSSNAGDQLWPKSAIFTDLYQVTMAYAYWKSGKHEKPAVFDLFIRKCPFQGEFAVFAGWTECEQYVRGWGFRDFDISYLRTALPATVEDDFFDYLSSLSTASVKITHMQEGEVVFPREPLITVEGPLAVCQLLETPLLNLINYATLCATCAARHRLAVGDRARLVEMGLRRAQGPNGAIGASKFCYLGGFDATSNLEAGRLYGIPVRGTQAHAFVTAFNVDHSLDNGNPDFTVISKVTSEPCDLYQLSVKWRCALLAICNNGLQMFGAEPNESELTAFVAYGRAFPDDFLALVDTYDTVKSGLINFCAVALALDELGFRAVGVRLDSGELARLSKLARKLFSAVADCFDAPWLESVTIVASNDLCERKLAQLEKEGHSIDVFGIGTHLVTCDQQPALGGVYKLVSIDGAACIKLSEDLTKVTLPGVKTVYRLFSKNGLPVVDLICLNDEPQPQVGKPVLCRHPIEEAKRLYVTPSKVVNLRKTVLFGEGRGGEGEIDPAARLLEARARLKQSLKTFDERHFRLCDPLHYKISLSERLHALFHKLWLENAPIAHIV